MELLSILEPTTGMVMWQVFLLSWVFFLIIASIDLAIHKFEENQKIFWLLLCIFVPFGWLIYFLIGRKQRIRT